MGNRLQLPAAGRPRCRPARSSSARPGAPSRTGPPAATRSWATSTARSSRRPRRSGAGSGLDSPAYDAGARIGLTSPDVPTPVENSGGGMSLPQLTSPSLFSGARMPFGGGADEPFLAQKAGRVGARLPSPHDAAAPRLPVFGRTSPDALAVRPRAAEYYGVPGGLAFTPPEPASPIRPVSHETAAGPGEGEDDGGRPVAPPGGRGPRVRRSSNSTAATGCSPARSGRRPTRPAARSRWRR